MNVKNWLQNAASELQAIGVSSYQLDAEILLAHTIGHPRTWLHAHSEEILDIRHQEIADARIDLRKDFVPIAYIIGHKEFYRRRFFVSPATLIPRPESEQMIELLKDVLPQTVALDLNTKKQLVDIGTGSGCLGVTAKLEFPELNVTLLDNNRQTLRIAEKNAKQYGGEVTVLQSDLLDNYPFSADIVLANLPYVNKAWDHLSRELEHEPAEALFAEKNGLAIITRCFDALSTRMQAKGVAIFEADPKQWSEIDTLAKSHGFSIHQTLEFAHSYTKD